MKKILMTLGTFLAVSLHGTTAFAQWSEPVHDGNTQTTYEEHGGLPGGGNAGGSSGKNWSYQPHDAVHGDYDAGQDGNQTKNVSQYHEAINPGGQTVGTDRFNRTDNWTETRTKLEPAKSTKAEPQGGGQKKPK